MSVRIGTLAALGLSAFLATTVFAAGPDPDTPVAWKKTVIEGKFRSEGVAIADVNKDGKRDVLDRRLLVRGPGLDQARHPEARRLWRWPAQLQQVHDLLG